MLQLNFLLNFFAVKKIIHNFALAKGLALMCKYDGGIAQLVRASDS